LFIATAVIEAATGLALLVAPGVIVGLLIGTAVETPGGMVIARVAGLAMLSIAIACWVARGDARGQALRGLLLGLLFYNSSIALLLLYAGFGLHLSAIGLWPAFAAHLAFAFWCAAGLRTPAASKS
jgi:hypothetical protein